MRKTILLLFCLLFSILNAQENKKENAPSETPPNVILLDDSIIYKLAQEQSIYHVIERAWIANQDVSYGSLFPVVTPIGKRQIPLRDGENNSGDSYLLEANFDLRFPYHISHQLFMVATI